MEDKKVLGSEIKEFSRKIHHVESLKMIKLSTIMLKLTRKPEKRIEKK